MMPAVHTSEATAALDVAAVRRRFPVLDREVHGKPLVYLDNAATTQKPESVIQSLSDYYRRYNANVHRGIHQLSVEATDAYEAARETVRAFLNARAVEEIIFTRGTTEAINLVAAAWGRAHLRPGDEVLITEIEHHSNIVPWQMICAETGATLIVARADGRGVVTLDEWTSRLSERTRLAAMVHVSNALGTVNPVAHMVRAAQAVGAVTLVDGAQALPHEPVDVQSLGCDFYAFSAHKVYGPTGIGVLYGRQALLEAMPPYQGGGDMIRVVSFSGTEYNDLPYRFEAGTPNIEGAIGMAAGLDFASELGIRNIARHEHELVAYGTEKLQALDNIRLIGTAPGKAAVLSFVFDDIHATDVGTLLDRQGIAIRVGHHCAMPVMEKFGVPGTCRASLAVYNTREDIDQLIDGLLVVREMFA